MKRKKAASFIQLAIITTLVFVSAISYTVYASIKQDDEVPENAKINS